MLIKGGIVFTGDSFEEYDLRVENGIITELIDRRINSASCRTDEDEIIIASCKYIVPGFVDIHTHGCIGGDFTTSDSDEICRMLEYYRANGTTSVLATVMTSPKDTIVKALRTLNSLKGIEGLIGARIEGPFLSEGKRGAHPAECLLPVTEEQYNEFVNAAGGMLKIVDIAPELDGAIDLIKAHSMDMVMSVAHTECTYDKAVEAFNAGAREVTHLFNAMMPLHHREPGVIGAVGDYKFNAELICDGFHIHPSVIRMMFREIADRIVLISDSLSATGLNDGCYTLGGQKINVQNGKALMPDGTIAGSTITMLEAVKRAVRFGITPEQAVKSATIIPARAAGADNVCGVIEVGRKADVLILDEKFDLVKVL